MAREKYLKWVYEGKVRNTVSHINMLNTRREFKQALEYCKSNEHKEASVSLVQKFRGKDFKGFWTEVKKKKAV